MSLNDTMIRRMLGEKKAARRMRNYPEGNDCGWAIIEFGFLAWCAAVVVVCALVAGGVR